MVTGVFSLPPLAHPFVFIAHTSRVHSAYTKYMYMFPELIIVAAVCTGNPGAIPTSAGRRKHRASLLASGPSVLALPVRENDGE